MVVATKSIPARTGSCSEGVAHTLMPKSLKGLPRSLPLASFHMLTNLRRLSAADTLSRLPAGTAGSHETANKQSHCGIMVPPYRALIRRWSAIYFDLGKVVQFVRGASVGIYPHITTFYTTGFYQFTLVRFHILVVISFSQTR